MHECTECGIDNDNPHSTSMCRDCQIRELMALLEDCKAAEQSVQADEMPDGEDSDRPLDDDEFQSWHDDPGYS